MVDMAVRSVGQRTLAAVGANMALLGKQRIMGAFFWVGH